MGFEDEPKYFFHYDPADVHFFPAACKVIKLFISLFQLYIEGNSLFQQLAATNYLVYHLLALNLFQKYPPPPSEIIWRTPYSNHS